MIVDCDTLRGFPGGSVVKKLLANAGDAGESIPGSGRSPEGGHGNPLQYSCLEKPMDRGAWQAAFHKAQGVRHDLVIKQQRMSGQVLKDCPHHSTQQSALEPWLDQSWHWGLGCDGVSALWTHRPGKLRGLLCLAHSRRKRI